MDPFRYVADMLHLAAVLLLISNMFRQRSAAGISLRTQFLYALVFTTRYCDILSFISVYNTVMKLFFLATSWYICYLMIHNEGPWKATYDRDNSDTLRLRYLIVPCVALSLLVHRTDSMHNVRELLWTFSVFLEAVAVLPQIFLLEYTERYDALTSHYLFALGAYRIFYIFSWVYRYFLYGSVEWISVVAGVVQTLLYVDFLYHYVQQVVRKAKDRFDLAR
jgi:ER lumen protein retaining receptor